MIRLLILTIGLVLGGEIITANARKFAKGDIFRLFYESSSTGCSTLNALPDKLKGSKLGTSKSGLNNPESELNSPNSKPSASKPKPDSSESQFKTPVGLEYHVEAFAQKFDSMLKRVFSTDQKPQIVKLCSPSHHDPDHWLKSGRMELPGWVIFFEFQNTYSIFMFLGLR